MKNDDIIARAIALSSESDETLLSMLVLQNVPVTRQAVRRVLKLRGYTFDQQTGQMTAGHK